MEGYCLMTRLLENPAVCLYYKDVENDSSVPFALNVVVAFIPSEALILDKKSAIDLCKRLNEDKDILLSQGYSEFEVWKVDGSPEAITNDEL